MTEEQAMARRFDTHYLLGAAAHLLEAMGNGEACAIQIRMAAQWSVAYRRYQAGERAAIPWMTARAEAQEVSGGAA